MTENFEKISSLVKQFEEHREDYHSKKYDESNTRTDFIDKFFEALGWDVRNNQGHAENYREVIREDKIMIEGKQKAPDYAFRIGGTVKFYVEAKKPSVDIKNDIDASYQLRRYAYTAKLPLSILTDFAEFAVYDTRIKPKATDNASNARIFYCTADDYEKHWEFIENTFSKEAILKGSFDRYIKDPKRKKGTSEVDKEFLKQIESWREDLAVNIALRNKDLSIYDLNFAIQKIIDRIIFLRIAEDRGMEEYGTLRKLSQNSETKFHIYAELIKYFKKADEKYNSGLFDLNEDKVTTKLTIDYKIFANIIDNLYYPNSPYEFSVLPIEILGNIYEQFLGKTIRLTEGHRAKVEDKPEVRKAGGVYYTPQYIVDYIVKNTLGEKLKEKTPKQIEDLTVLDPACGSGSFLITAYEYLLNFYLDYYSSDKQRDKALKDKKIFEIGERGYKLGIDEKKEILTQHIYGVDIDSQAVEVTKLSLLLKLMEDERLETSQYLFTRRAMKLLPDLSSNIKCGNSLIGTDFYEGQQVEMFDDEMVRKINAFDWDKQFPAIFSHGGFDVVIGNPPYIKEYTNKDAFIFKKGKLGKYYQGKMDIWYAFACLSIDLLRDDSYHSFIATNNWITSFGALKLREKILNESQLISFIDFSGYMVFDNASIQTMIYVCKKEKTKSHDINYMKILDSNMIESDLINSINKNVINNSIISFNTKLKSISTSSISFNDKYLNGILNKLVQKSSITLLDHELTTGIDVHQDFVNKNHLKTLGNKHSLGEGIFIISSLEKDALKLSKIEGALIKPYYTTEQLKQYWANPNNNLWVIYTSTKEIKVINSFPKIKSHLDQFKQIITSDFGPYGLHRARNEEFFKGEKILSLRKTVKPCFTFSDFPCYVSQSYYVIQTKRTNLRYLTAYLNSNISFFWLKNFGKRQGDLLQVDKEPLMRLPIILLPEQEQKEIEKIEMKIESILKSKMDKKDTTIHDKEINRLKELIDHKLYDYIGLSKEEIEIMEKV
ncbi:MAG: N-6 DNA methylase [bacterium]|nr:N-6 DNA methylase [bacterium]